MEFLGLYLGKKTAQYHDSSLPGDILDRWLSGNDRAALKKYPGKTIIIDPAPITTLRFDLSDVEKEFLLAAGRSAALDFLSRKEEFKSRIDLDRVKNARQLLSDLHIQVEDIHKRLRRKRRLGFAALFVLLLLIFTGSILGWRYLYPKYTPKPEAVELYNTGNTRLSIGGTQADSARNITEAIELFEEAKRRDENYVAPYLGLASAYAQREDNVGAKASESLPQALDNARMALEKARSQGAENSIPEIHSLLGFIYFCQRDWEQSKKEFEIAKDKNASSDTYRAYARLLRTLGDNEKSRTYLKKALEIQESGIIYTNIGMLDLIEGNVDSAFENFSRASRFKGNFANYSWMSVAYIKKGEFDKAVAEAEEGNKLLENNHGSKAFLGYAYAKQNNIDGAKKILEELNTAYDSVNRSATAVDIAIVYAGLGDRAQTIHWLNNAVTDKSGVLAMFIVMPQFDFLHGDKDYEDIKYNKMKIPRT
jgi:tetratricopeptide (TPR) repeat protein